MRVAKILGITAVLQDDWTWYTSNDRIKPDLDAVTARLLRDYSPADGWLDPYLFFTTVERMLGEVVLYDEPEPEFNPNVEY